MMGAANGNRSINHTKDITAAEEQTIPNPLHLVITGWILGVD
ncbi:MAG TPA: hypothetical protein VIE66_18755 [Methylocella sp.]|jgi:hypothetical protein